MKLKKQDPSKGWAYNEYKKIQEFKKIENIEFEGTSKLKNSLEFCLLGN